MVSRHWQGRVRKRDDRYLAGRGRDGEERHERTSHTSLRVGLLGDGEERHGGG